MGMKTNLVIDFIMFILILIVAFSERHIHQVAGYLLMGFIGLHIIVHLEMIVCWIKNFFRKKSNICE
ncbi:hypothetical protein J4467_03895 [Candidatus Woesearchaeota archaeon]|nr:hypothetical protein [Candidatus Woesearchaeota archaeon]